MKTRHINFAFLILLGLLFGCGEKQGEVSSAVEAVATLGAHRLTAAELDARAGNIVALYRHKMGEKVNTNFLAKVEAMFREGYAKIWTEDRVLEDYAAAQGVAPDPSVVTNLQRGAFQNFRVKSDKTYAAMLAASGVNEAYWQDQVTSEARRAAVRKHWAAAEPLPDPDAAVAAELEMMRRWNEMAAATNAVQWAKATNVWEQIKADGDFVKIAKATTELKEELEDDCEWAILDAKFFEDEPALSQKVRAMKVGEVSEPIAADNGICIVRLDALEDDEGYRVSRVFIHLAKIMNPAPNEEIRAALEAEHAEQLFVRKLEELVSAEAKK